MTVTELMASIRTHWLLVVIAAVLGAMLSLSVWALSPPPTIVKMFVKVSHTSLLSGDQLMDIKLRYGVSIDFLDENSLRLSATSTTAEVATTNVERVVEYLDGLATLHDNARAAVAHSLLDEMEATLAQLSATTDSSPTAVAKLHLKNKLELLRRELSADRFISPGTKRIEVEQAPRTPAKPVLSGLGFGLFAGVLISALLSVRSRRLD